MKKKRDVPVSWVQNLWDYVTRMHMATFVVVIFLTLLPHPLLCIVQLCV